MFDKLGLLQPSQGQGQGMSPQQLGLLAAGLQMMRPYNRYKGFGDHIANAGMAGVGAYANAQQMGQEQQLRQLQTQLALEKLRREQEAAQAQAESERRRQELVSQLPPDQQRALGLGVGYDAIWKRENPEPEKPVLVEVADPQNPTRTVKKWVRPGEMEGVMVGRGALPDILDPAVQAARSRVAEAGATRLNVENYPNPMPVIGPDGKPALVQFGKHGDMRETPYKPINDKSIEDQAKRERSAKTVLQVLDEAEPLIDQATGSYLGAAGDLVGQAVGYSTPSAQAAAQLRALEGAVMMAQPRMEGPQSDKDVALYRQMAGQIGDPTVPAATKKAAVQAIRRLHSKYAPAETQPSDAVTQPRPALDSFFR